jgi:glycine/D-amino acid oxidase-like deaminating enzyme
VKQFDVAVVGAGILGACAAWHLARAGRSVVVLEAGEPGNGTSANSFAWVNAVRKEPEAYHRLNADGVAAYAALASELRGDVGYRPGGSLEWTDDAASDAELRGRVARLAHRGYAAELVTREAALALEPGLAIGASARSIAFYARDAWVDAPRLVRVLLDDATSRGAEVRGGAAVRSARTRGARIDAVVTDAGEVLADSALFCVGPATAEVLAPLGVKVPVQRVPGLLAVTTAPSAPLGRVVHAPGVHLRPEPGGGLRLGAEDIDKLITETAAPPGLGETLLERARRAFPPARQAQLAGTRIGVRPMPRDGHTIAGRIPGLANGFVVVTHSAVTMGPLLGRLIAAEIAGQPPSPQLAPFRPDRF